MNECSAYVGLDVHKDTEVDPPGRRTRRVPGGPTKLGAIPKENPR